MLKIALWILGVVITLVVVATVIKAGLAGLSSDSSGETQVWIETLELGDLTEIASAPGDVEPLTKVEISARVSARVTKLPHRAGDRVVADGPEGPSLLIELDASDIRAQLESAEKRRDGLVAQVAVEKKRIAGLEASLSGTRLILEDMQRELARQEALQATGDVSEKDREQAQRSVDEIEARFNAESASLDAARLGLNVSQFNIEAADADIRQITEALSYTEIVSPINGVVTKTNVDVGEIAITGTMNNPGTVLLEVADMSRMLVVARLDEANIERVAVGQPAEVRLMAFPGRVFAGEVRSVALAVTQVTSGLSNPYFEVEVLLDQTPDLTRTGLSADVEIQVQQHAEALLVPSQAILSRPIDDLPAAVRENNPAIDKTRANTTVVFMIKDAKVIAVPVQIGASDSLNTIITRGLEPGASVVTGPFAILENLKHDQTIRVVRRDGKDVSASKDIDPKADSAASNK